MIATRVICVLGLCFSDDMIHTMSKNSLLFSCIVSYYCNSVSFVSLIYFKRYYSPFSNNKISASESKVIELLKIQMYSARERRWPKRIKYWKADRSLKIGDR